MKIALVNPPSPFLINQKAFPPLGILYLAGYLIKSGFQAEVIDLAQEESNLEEKAAEIKADFYGITATTPQYPWAKKIKDIINKKNNKAKICLGGSHASSVPERCLEDGFDFVVIGEGELALEALIKRLSCGKERERLIRSPYIKILDSLPFPERNLINLKDYGYEIDDNKATTIITSRGCPFNCAFCSKDVWSGRVRYHSPNYVIAEINEIISKFGFRHLLFLDDVLTLDKQRLFDICSGMKDLNVKWRCYARPDSTTKEMLFAMKEAGCVEIGFGLESASQKILNSVDKKLKVENATRFVRDCKEAGIAVNVFIMIGLPGETHESVQDTKKWIEENRPEKFGFNIYAPFVGTEIFNHRDKYDIKIYPMPDEDSWVKGRLNEYKSFVSTKGLGRQEILRLFNELFAYYSQLLNWKPGVGNLQKADIQ